MILSADNYGDISKKPYAILICIRYLAYEYGLIVLKVLFQTLICSMNIWGKQCENIFKIRGGIL